MSVSSGVPVFRNKDGTMSPEFSAFLEAYNEARKRHSLPSADDWFSFSVSEMFRKETEQEAWAYWRWRMLRALKQPAEDYKLLGQIIEYFGKERVFVVTSNCDGLHEAAGVPAKQIKEIHGSLAMIQCSGACCDKLWPVDEAFLDRLRDEPKWVPRCPECEKYCLRPNVMIFDDHTLVHNHLSDQDKQYRNFRDEMSGKWLVLEIGAGVVVASIRLYAETLATDSEGGLIRINPNQDECEEMQTNNDLEKKYFPVASTSSVALRDIVKELGISSETQSA